MNDALKMLLKNHLTDGIECEPTPMQDENAKINTSPVFWEKAFVDLFLEVLDLDTGYNNAKEGYTRALLESGSKINPHDMYQFIDLLQVRVGRIHIIKRVCNFLGLHEEMEKIIEHELNLIYKHPSGNSNKITFSTTSPIAGEIK